MSNIQWVGTPSDRVHRDSVRYAQKRQRWMYVPKKKEPVSWLDIKLILECSVVTVACVVALFFAWFYAGI